MERVFGAAIGVMVLLLGASGVTHAKWSDEVTFGATTLIYVAPVEGSVQREQETSEPSEPQAPPATQAPRETSISDAEDIVTEPVPQRTADPSDETTPESEQFNDVPVEDPPPSAETRAPSGTAPPTETATPTETSTGEPTAEPTDAPTVGDGE